MNIIEILIAFGIMIMAWIGTEFIEYSEQPDNIFVYIVNAEERPLITRTGPGNHYARTGIIYNGTFEIVVDSVINDEGDEWAIVKISQFSDKEVFVPIDYSVMTTAWIKRNKFIKLGSNK